ADSTIVGTWPSDEAVDALKSALKVAPPKGAEFGKTEIFYLKATDKDSARAASLVNAIYEQLKANLGEIRAGRARGIISELEKVATLADADLQHETRRLKEMETLAGADLIELRMVFQGTAVDGELNKTLGAGQSELRQWKTAQAANREMLRILQAAERDPQQLIAAPASLLDSQPTLRQLRQGLAEAQLRTSALAGAMTESHPQLVVAREAEHDLQRVIYKEVASAIRGVEGDFQLTDSRIHAAEEQLAEQRARVARLAGLRAEYSNLVDLVEHRRTELEQAKHGLAETRAEQASSFSSSVISAVGLPEGASTPIGPSRAMTAIFGLAGGLLAGLGILYLTVPSREPAHALNGRLSPPAIGEDQFQPTNGAAHYVPEAKHLELMGPAYANGDAPHKPR
ncbi:MAG TPA: hypothetical protein VG056_09245, partial [Pirellulales bacterium]|nr:hypothetical protein [Pirellulales bacterium]